MNDFEIQREAIVEIVGTQYEDRAKNHNNLALHQRLILKRQKNNEHDKNAVLILTEDGKELGFIPKGQASIYAPVIDSNKYNFFIEVIKTEQDLSRPILIVKIITERKNLTEQNTWENVISFVQDIVNWYNVIKKEYLQFIQAEDVNMDSLIKTLNKARLINKLYSSASEIIEQNNIIPVPSAERVYFTNDSLIDNIKSIQTDINEILKKLKKTYDDSIDIEDEDEYQRVQSNTRMKIKNFRSMNNLCDEFCNIINDFSPVHIDAATKTSVSEKEPKPIVKTAGSVVDNKTEITSMPKETRMTEQDFENWLVSKGGVSETTAKQYISNIHSIEKLYQTIFGYRKYLIGISSRKDAEEMICDLIKREEYIDANERRHNSFGAALAKYIQFAEISAEIPSVKNNKTDKKQDIIPTVSKSVVKIVDFENPYDCTGCKPIAYTYCNIRYLSSSWIEVYQGFLKLIFQNKSYEMTLRNFSGKALYGRCIDFADSTLISQLRRPIKVHYDFYVEANLSTNHIVKNIAAILKLCSIDYDLMKIEYMCQEVISSDRTKEIVELENSETNAEQSNNKSYIDYMVSKGLTYSTAQWYESAIKTCDEYAHNHNLYTGLIFNTTTLEAFRYKYNALMKNENFISINKMKHMVYSAALNKYEEYLKSIIGNNENITFETQKNSDDTVEIKESKQNTQSVFSPDKSQPFELKNAIISILSSDDENIRKLKNDKNGITSKAIQDMIKEYYGKSISIFEISKLLMLNPAFISCGKNSYAVNQAMMLKKENEEIVSGSQTAFTEESEETEQPSIFDVSSNNNEETINIAEHDNNHLSEKIIDVIIKNKDNLQYEDGFGAYEVKILLSNDGISDISEDEIEKIMADSSELEEIEDGYYIYCGNNNTTDNNVISSEITVETDDIDENEGLPRDISEKISEPSEKKILPLRLNGNIIRAFDYSDALCKICEFAINYKPFKMARIAGDIRINGKRVFYRSAVPNEDCNKLSNGLQVININNIADLKFIAYKIKEYCQINDNMIIILDE